MITFEQMMWFAGGFGVGVMLMLLVHAFYSRLCSQCYAKVEE